jgi:hypothetical protein
MNHRAAQRLRTLRQTVLHLFTALLPSRRHSLPM